MKSRFSRLLIAIVAAASILTLSGCAMIESFISGPKVFKYVTEVKQPYVNGSFQANYVVQDRTEYWRKWPILAEEIPDYQKGTVGRYEDIAANIRAANEWIKDEWVIVVGAKQEWDVHRDAYNNIIDRDLTFAIFVDNREQE